MKKAVAEVIAGVIPRKMARNRWRGILRYGPLRALRLRLRMRRRDLPAPRHYLAVCAIAKNEALYFAEWIEWHRSQGVEKFYIYDNDSTDNTREVLEPYIASGLVEYTPIHGQCRQLDAYDDCLERHRLDARWIAVIDLDEFIVPLRHASIPDFLRPLERFSSVEVNWLVYGSSGARTRLPGTMMERFRRHSLPAHRLNTHVKSIVDPRRVCCMTGCHEAARIAGRSADSHGEPLTRGFRDRVPQQDVIRINHYAVKSYEEFLAKRARGRARIATQRDLSYFDRYDLNDLED